MSVHDIYPMYIKNKEHFSLQKLSRLADSFFFKNEEIVGIVFRENEQYFLLLPVGIEKLTCRSTRGSSLAKIKLFEIKLRVRRSLALS